MKSVGLSIFEGQILKELSVFSVTGNELLPEGNMS